MEELVGLCAESAAAASGTEKNEGAGVTGGLRWVFSLVFTSESVFTEQPNCNTHREEAIHQFCEEKKHPVLLKSLKLMSNELKEH